MNKTMSMAALFCAVFILCLSFSTASADGEISLDGMSSEDLTGLKGQIDEKIKKDLANTLSGEIEDLSLDELNVLKEKIANNELVKEEFDDPKHDTRFIFFHHGAVLVSPYKIIETTDTTVTPNTTTFTIGDSGSSDTNYYMEAYGRYRNAFLGYKCEGVCLDFDGRLGVVAGTQDAAAAVVKGSGNAYFDMSLGLLVNFYDGKLRNNNLTSKKDDSEVSYSINPEFIIGGVTDKQNQDVNLHYGVGVSFVAGIPFRLLDKNDTVSHRKTEFLLGAYVGEADLPVFKDIATKTLEQEHGYAKYDTEGVYIFKGEFSIPVRKEAYLTINSKFFKKKNGENVNPWTISFGLTLPIHDLAKSFASIIKGESGERAESITEEN